jgi:hypothetical protein
MKWPKNGSEMDVVMFLYDVLNFISIGLLLNETKPNQIKNNRPF